MRRGSRQRRRRCVEAATLEIECTERRWKPRTRRRPCRRVRRDAAVPAAWAWGHAGRGSIPGFEKFMEIHGPAGIRTEELRATKRGAPRARTSRTRRRSLPSGPPAREEGGRRASSRRSRDVNRDPGTARDPRRIRARDSADGLERLNDSTTVTAAAAATPPPRRAMASTGPPRERTAPESLGI